jgi:hypothetical protein
MAVRGAKPKPTRLHLVDGTYRPDRHPEAEPQPDGPIRKPAKLRGRAGELWDEFIARAHWLTWADGPKALSWCHLQAEFERSPTKMVASRIAQLRGLGSELGFDPTSRARMGTTKANAKSKFEGLLGGRAQA